MTSPRSDTKGPPEHPDATDAVCSANAATRVFSVSSSRSVPEKRSSSSSRDVSACVARSSPHTPAAASSRRRIAVRNAEDQPMAYPSAATRAPTGGGAAASGANVDGKTSFSFPSSGASRFRDVAISETLGATSSSAMSARSRRGCTATTDPTRVGAFAASLARTSTRLSGPARHATCAAVSTRRSPPAPSRDTTTPDPRLDDRRNGNCVLAACGATTTVAARTDASASSGDNGTGTACVVREPAPLSSALARAASHGRDRTRRRGGRRDATATRRARPRSATGSFRDGHVAEADGDATGVGGIAPVSRRAHAGTPATARGRAPPRARARLRRVPRPNATWRPPIENTRTC